MIPTKRAELHLILQSGKHHCPCGEKAIRIFRCTKCRGVIARCGLVQCGTNIDAERARHC
jgi:hypothetical protein